MTALLARAPEVDGVFASSDLMAVGALRAISRGGRRVPDHVAVVGFDDAPVAQHKEAQLTTVHQPIEEMGRAMVELLLARIAHRRAVRHVVPEPHLVVRSSA